MDDKTIPEKGVVKSL